MTDKSPSLESVARIIDPYPFDFLEMSDAMNTAGLHKAEARKAEAMKKAQAIVALWHSR